MKLPSILTPVMFAVYYVLFLYSVNVSETALTELPLPLALLVLLAVVTWALLRLILRDGNKAAILATLFMFAFSSTGHIAMALNDFHIFGLPFYRHRYWLPLFAIFLLTISWFIIRSRRSLSGTVGFVNTMLGILMAISLLGVGRSHLMMSKQPSADDRSEVMPAATGSTVGYKPDIYYIILDGYASSITLERMYDFDNSPFINKLRSQGFFVADSSFCNYAFTPSSLSSSLNMEYVNYVAETYADETALYSASYRLVRTARVARYLKELGYSYVLLRSGFTATNSSPLADLTVRCGHYNEFIKVLIHTTVLKFVEKHLIFLEWHRENIRGILDYLKGEAPSLKSPKFVFTHILIPHPPYIFDAEGNSLKPDFSLLGQNKWQPLDEYVDQLRFLNGEILEVVEGILSASDRDPIIIIQGDHGPAATDDEGDPSDELVLERMTILNAYHLPGGVDSLLYDGISPVNSFRLLFREYFGMELEPLDDRAYFSHVLSRFSYVDETDRVRRLLRETALATSDSTMVTAE